MKQKAKDRKARLDQGCCPVHGIWMSQVDTWYQSELGKLFTYVGCTRRACKIRARAYGFDGPWEMLDEFNALLDDNLEDPQFLDINVSPAKKKKSLKTYKKIVWSRTAGKCFFCGTLMTYEQMTIDHFVPEAKGGTNSLINLVPACRSCNSLKGVKTITEFRHYMEQRDFMLSKGVSFTADQIHYLHSVGVDLNITPHIFWFEKSNISLEKCLDDFDFS